MWGGAPRCWRARSASPTLAQQHASRAFLGLAGVPCFCIRRAQRSAAHHCLLHRQAGASVHVILRQLCVRAFVRLSQGLRGASRPARSCVACVTTRAHACTSLWTCISRPGYMQRLLRRHQRRLSSCACSTCFLPRRYITTAGISAASTPSPSAVPAACCCCSQASSSAALVA